MANLGVGLAFGARDTGQKAAFQGAEKNLDTMGKLLDDQNTKGKASSKIWGKLRDRVKDFNIASIAKNVRGLTGETGKLMSGIEGLSFQATVAAKPILAQIDLTDKQHRKMMNSVTSLAVELNVGGEVVAETLRSIHTAGASAALGIEAMAMSEKEWIKVTQTTGVTMEDYQAVLGNMIGSWGASPKAAASMVNNMIAIGKAAKTGAAGLKSMKGQMDAVDNVFEKLPPSMARSGDEIKSLMESTVALSGAFKDLGETNEKSMELAQSTGMMFAEQSVAIVKAQHGMGSFEDSPLFEWMTKMGISGAEAVDIINEGSVDVVRGAKRIQDALQLGVARGTLSADAAILGLNEAMGASAGGLAYLVGNLDQGATALGRVSELTVEGAEALKKYGKQAHSTGRDLQEQFDFAKEKFETQIRSITRSDVRKMVGEQMGGYREAAKDLKEMAGKDGILGELITTASRFKQMGPSGLFLGLAKSMGISGKEATKFTAKFGFAFESLQEFGTALQPVMEILGMFGPAGLVVGGIAGFFMLNDKDQAKILVGVEKLWGRVAKAWDDKVVPGIIKYWPKIAKGAEAIWEYITKEIPWKKLGDEVIWPILKETGKIVWDSLKWAWTKVGEEMGVGGQFAIGALVLGGSGGGGLLGAGAQFSAAIASNFGVTGIIGAAMITTAIAAAAIIANAHKEQKEAARRFDIPRTKKAARMIGRGKAQIELRRETFGAMSTEDIGRGIESGAFGQRDIDRMLKQEDFAPRMRGDAELKKKLKSIFAISAKAKGGDTSQEGIDRAFTEFETKFSTIQKLPEVQMELEKAFASKDAGVVANRLSVISDAYRGSISDLSKLAVEAEDTRGKVEEALLGVEAGKYGGEKTAEEEAALNLLGEKVKTAFKKAESAAVAAMGADFDYIKFGGMDMVGQLADGIDSPESVAKVKDATGTMLKKGVKNLAVAESPVPEGPLSQDALFKSGKLLAETFANGFADSGEYIAEIVGTTLDNSVMKTIEEYDAKMANLMKQKDLLAGVAKSMMGSFGADVTTAEFEGEKIDVEKRMEAMINIPGMAGVVGAVVRSGAETQVILKKIYQETKRTADTLDQVSKKEGGKAVGIVLAQ